MAARIIGTGSYLPDNIVTNEYLSTLVETSDEWISTRTGIRERRISSGEGTAQLAGKAAQAAILDARIDANIIDHIFVATMTADNFLPNTASEVQSIIGAMNATCFDINAACTGFVFALNTAYAYIEAGLANAVLVVGAETVSKQIDWTDRSTCVLFGDGAGAVIVKKSEERGIIGTVTSSDGLKKDVLTCKSRNLSNPFVKGNNNDDYMKMEGQEVFKFATKKVTECIELLLEQTHTNCEDVNLYVLHQANKRIIDSVAKRLKVSIDKFPMNIDRYANTSAATIPILLDELNQQKRIKNGDKIVISGFGGGLTWGATLIEW